MAFLSKLFGRQVNKATQMAAHRGVGAVLTFDSSADFPDILTLRLPAVICGKLDAYLKDGVTPNPKAIDEKFDYMDTSTKNLYVDESTNTIYRWKHFSKKEWAEANWEWVEVTDAQGNPVLNPDGTEKTQYVEPTAAKAPKLEDYNSQAEYEEAMVEWNNSLYPKYDENGHRVYEYNVGGAYQEPTDKENTGWAYVMCSGGGGGDLYWSQI